MKKYLSIFTLLLAGILTIAAAVMLDDGDVHKKYIVIHHPNDAKPDTLFVEDVDSITFGDSLIHIPQIVSVKFDRDTLNIHVGQSENITYKVLEDGVDQDCSIKVNDLSIITYSVRAANTVEVKGESEGVAQIVAIASDGIHSDTCYVVVDKEPVIEVNDVSLDQHILDNLQEGSSYKLMATVLPADAADKSIKWSSTDEKVATVDNDGFVTAVSAGTATIVAEASNGVSDRCRVTVVAKPSKVAVKNVILDSNREADVYGTPIYLTAHLYPEGAEASSVKWSCISVTSSATITPDSLSCQVNPLKAGTAEITVTVNDTLSATCTLTVGSSPSYVSVTGVTLSEKSLDMTIDDTKTITATVSPADATDPSITWTSSNPGVASVKDGLVTALAEGTAVITVTTTDGKKTATCNVTVSEPETPVAVTGIAINNSDEFASMNYGSTCQIDYSVEPADATNQKVTFTSKDPSVASVSSTGLVTAKSAGSTVITVTSSSDTQVSESIKVSVISVPAEINTVKADSWTSSSANISLVLSGDPATVSEAGVEYSETNDFVTTQPQSVKITSISSSNTVTISDLKEETTYYYRGYIVVDGKTETTDPNSFTTRSSKKFPVATAVDLDLPSGLKWASWNMGAGTEQELGGYYAWGDITGEIKHISEYTAPTVTNISGNPDYDIATAQWGSEWRMPYVSEIKELFDNCTQTTETVTLPDGSTVSLRKLTSKKNSNYIYLPRAGSQDEGVVSKLGTAGYYWTSEAHNLPTCDINFWGFTSNTSNWQDWCHGSLCMSVRPVFGKYVAPKSDEEKEAEDRAGETSAAGTAVNLGLSVRWANFNVGATRPSDYGDYFSWGDTIAKESYDLDHYNYYEATTGDYTFIGSDISGVENYDAATHQWKGKWRMPTKDEFDALKRDCKWEWTTVDGTNGYKVYGVGDYSDNYIFLPAAGWVSGMSMDQNSNGYYWTSNVKDMQTQYSWYISFDKDSSTDAYFSREVGRCIRPVKPLMTDN